jgi:hypothetical protein
MIIEKLVNYIIIPEIKLIVECYKGCLTDEEVLNHKNTMYGDNKYDPAFNVITDMRELEMQVQDDDDIKNLCKFIDFLKNTPVGRRGALLTSKPNQAVLAQLFKELARNTPIEYEVFSTIDAALIYVGLPLNKYDIVNDALERLTPSYE